MVKMQSFFFSSHVRLWPNRNLSFLSKHLISQFLLPSSKKQTLESAAHLVCKAHPEFRRGNRESHGIAEGAVTGGVWNWRGPDTNRRDANRRDGRDASQSSRQCASPPSPVLCDTMVKQHLCTLGSTVAPKDVQHSQTIKPLSSTIFKICWVLETICPRPVNFCY